MESHILYFDFDNTNINPAGLYGGNKMILADTSNDKQSECKKYNDIPVKIPSHL